MPVYHWDFSVLLQYHAILLDGMLMTGKIVAASVTLSIIGGMILAPLRGASSRLVRFPAQGLIEVVRSVPPLVLIVWAYYCLPILFGLTFSSYWTCVLAIALYGSVFFAEIFRSGLQSVDHGLVEAGLSVGMTPLKVLLRVTGPVAFLRILPAFVSQCVMSIKNSVLASYIATGELLYQGQRLSTATFRPLETLTFVALFFVVTILPLSLLASYAERKIRTRYFKR
ncbi:amino acid ABC transporter permease [Erwinia sp. S43]|uniref:amino acid ABC transporter permease n=1 Tax=Erwiniaceae TaxID=1903409 RepID=UPI001909DECC|nr:MULTISPECIES: amino acid ABC transporter permease [Erwiniaceae]MBK0033586.1 amino acid ABC transporter permease [Erwinia sp. S43]MBM7345223.1 polar amino acid transport system permease protein [Pantoea coffeiphila]